MDQVERPIVQRSYREDLQDLRRRMGQMEGELRHLADADARCALQFRELVEIVGRIASDMETVKLHVGVEHIEHPRDEADWWEAYREHCAK